LLRRLTYLSSCQRSLLSCRMCQRRSCFGRLLKLVCNTTLAYGQITSQACTKIRFALEKARCLAMTHKLTSQLPLEKIHSILHEPIHVLPNRHRRRPLCHSQRNGASRPSEASPCDNGFIYGVILSAVHSRQSSHKCRSLPTTFSCSLKDASHKPF
jgi:hypothetical protein